MNKKEILEGGTVVSANDSFLVVEVDGIEVYIGAAVEFECCERCGDSPTLDITYNVPRDDDPLGIR